MTDVIKTLFGMVAAPIFIVGGFAVMYFTLNLVNIDVLPIASLIVGFAPIWLPLALFVLAYKKWIIYVRKAFALDNGRVTLRIKLPQDVTKSPEAMERVISQIYNPNNPDNPYQGWVDGKHPLIFSFELVSIGGEVRFYLNVPKKKTKNAIEAQLYAQYPGIEIVEEEVDYTAEIPWDPEKYEYMSFHVGKKEDQEYPIKTYIDYGMDKLPKEEEKIEPMAPMLEQLASAQSHERIWLQILARPHVKKDFKNGELTKTPSWEKKVLEKIDGILGRHPGKKTGPAEFEDQPRLTAGEKDTIAAMERNASKYAFETIIRWMYIAEAGKFDGNFIGPMLRSFSEYDVISRNAVGPRWRTDFDYNIFADPFGTKKMKYKKAELLAYKLREYDHYTEADKPKVFTAEELATMYHIPGQAVATPGLDRIPSTRGEAPPNLPTK